jgi:hydrogenase maturation protease
MNRSLIDPIADAVLYEGYILYPYRPSIKNRQRWTFGGLFPEDYCRVHATGDSSTQQTECLIRGSCETILEVVVRFLRLIDRKVAALDSQIPCDAWRVGEEPPSRPVDSLWVDGRLVRAWQEAEPCEVIACESTLAGLLKTPARQIFDFPASRSLEPLIESGNKVVGLLIREQQAVEGLIEVATAEVADGLYRITVQTSNRTGLPGADLTNREEAILHSLISTHVMLGVSEGTFVSLMDPQDDCRDAAAACRNIGVWPVLVGENPGASMMLSSPIILDDYPRIAPESPGDLFDGTEIDEILTLRIMTLTDEEKGAMTELDERTRNLLERTESLADEQFLALHGTLRAPVTKSSEGD